MGEGKFTRDLADNLLARYDNLTNALLEFILIPRQARHHDEAYLFDLLGETRCPSECHDAQKSDKLDCDLTGPLRIASSRCAGVPE
jgi:hypothetical protein